MDIKVTDDTGERFSLNPVVMKKFLREAEPHLTTREDEAPAHSLANLVDELQEQECIYCPAGLRVWICAVEEHDSSGWVVGVARALGPRLEDGTFDYEAQHPIIVEGYIDGLGVLPEDQMINREDVSPYEHARSMVQPILDTANGVIERCARTEPWSQTGSADR